MCYERRVQKRTKCLRMAESDHSPFADEASPNHVDLEGGILCWVDVNTQKLSQSMRLQESTSHQRRR